LLSPSLGLFTEEVKADLAHGDGGMRVEPAGKLVQVIGTMFLLERRMQAVGWENIGMAVPERGNGVPAAAMHRRNYHGMHATFVRSRDHLLAIVVKACIIQVEVAVNQYGHGAGSLGGHGGHVAGVT